MVRLSVGLQLISQSSFCCREYLVSYGLVRVNLRRETHLCPHVCRTLLSGFNQKLEWVHNFSKATKCHRSKIRSAFFECFERLPKNVINIDALRLGDCAQIPYCGTKKRSCCQRLFKADTHTRSHCIENRKKTVKTSFTYSIISDDHGNIQ